jgi:hypothetical protein
MRLRKLPSVTKENRWLWKAWCGRQDIHLIWLSRYQSQAIRLSQNIFPPIFYFRDWVKISADEICEVAPQEYFRKSLCTWCAVVEDLMFGMEYSISVLHRGEAQLVTKTAGTERDLLHHDGDVAPHRNCGYNPWTLVFKLKFQRLILELRYLKSLISVLGEMVVSHLIEFPIRRLRGRAMWRITHCLLTTLTSESTCVEATTWTCHQYSIF